MHEDIRIFFASKWIIIYPGIRTISNNGRECRSYRRNKEVFADLRMWGSPFTGASPGKLQHGHLKVIFSRELQEPPNSQINIYQHSEVI